MDVGLGYRATESEDVFLGKWYKPWTWFSVAKNPTWSPTTWLTWNTGTLITDVEFMEASFVREPDET